MSAIKAVRVSRKPGFVSQEIELKLEVDPDELALVREYPLLARSESHTDHQLTIYYDTPETKLKKHGLTLRVRSTAKGFIQTVKPIADQVGLMSREEIESDVASMEPEIDRLTGHPIHTLLDRRDCKHLEPLVRCDVNRTSWHIDAKNGRFRVELDHGTVSAGKRSRPFAEIEFELVDGGPAGLIGAARRLSDHVPVRLGVLTKAERGFLLTERKLGRVAKAAPIKVHDGMTVGEAFELIVHSCLKHYRLNEPLVIRRSKPEALHQARVALRRLRSAFTLFRPAIEDVEFQHLRHELRWFTAQMGEARNLDVFLARGVQEEERPKLILRRERAYEVVADAMNSHKARRLLIDLVAWTAIGAWRLGKPASRPITGFANRRLDRLWRSIAGAGRDIAHMDDSTRHGLRIQIKKMRYAVDFLNGLYPDSRAVEKRFATAVAELQERLGDLNDLATAQKLVDRPLTDDWLIGSYEERRLLIAAEQAFRALLDAGPFWRADAVQPAPRRAHLTEVS